MAAVSADRAVGATPVRAVGVGSFSRRPMFLFSFFQINVFIFYDFVLFAFNFFCIIVLLSKVCLGVSHLT
jgi:hypothetical protein